MVRWRALGLLAACLALGGSQCYPGGSALRSREVGPFDADHGSGDGETDGETDGDHESADADLLPGDADDPDPIPDADDPDGNRRCDPSWCRGCCDGDLCRAGTMDEACGTAGRPCRACSSGESCLAGTCTSCDARVCPDGCCAGPVCHPPTFETCGVAGAPCERCSPDTADLCSESGECRCGLVSACRAGQRCESGACVCDGVSCPGGCCWGPTCHEPTLATCGVGGGLCVTCDPARADDCSPLGECTCAGGPVCAAGQVCAPAGCF